MPRWLHRTNKQLLTSVAENDLPEAVANYIEEPDLSGVQGVPPKYWNIVGDTVSEMNASEKAAVDAAETAAALANAQTIALNDADDTVRGVGHEIRAIIEIFNKRDNYLTNRIVELQEDLQAIKASSGGASTIRGAIRNNYLATNTRPKPDAVQDYKDEITSGGADS